MKKTISQESMEKHIKKTISVESAAELIMLIAELTDKRECKYDREGYCQTHSLDLKPCPHERAKTLIDKVMKGLVD